jgi:hypothetical protein
MILLVFGTLVLVFILWRRHKRRSRRKVNNVVVQAGRHDMWRQAPGRATRKGL